MTKHSSERSLRIIGGKWRSRKISFPNREDIRPTPDRIRETLFNWLAPYVAGSRCLELYAGSGVLSMEALSRGAAHVTLIERDRETWVWLRENLSRLAADTASCRCIHGTALDWVRANHDAFDIVFLDPPFRSGELAPVLGALAESGSLTEDALVYVETPAALDASILPANLAIIRSGKAGQVHYSLCAMQR